MAVNKVILGSETLLDLTGDTATAADVAEGKTFHLANGVQAVGTASGGGGGGGGTGSMSDPIRFFDYDGTVVASYTAVPSALPPNPSHSGLVAQGWNYTLAEIQEQFAATGTCDVGQMYITESNDTEIDIVLHEGRLEPYLNLAPNGTVTIDWGDGSSTDTLTGTSLSTRKGIQHSYTAVGDYTITVHVVSGSVALYGTTDYMLLNKDSTINHNRVYSNCVQAVRIGASASIGAYAFYYCHSLSSVTIPSSVTSIGNYAFRYCFSLPSVTIPSSVTSIGNNAFNSCYSLSLVTIPSSVTSIDTSAFNGCSSLPSVTIPSSVTSINSSAFYGCFSLPSVTIPSSVTSIGNNAFNNCCGLGEIHFLRAMPPTVSNRNVWTGIPTDCVIYVPAGTLSAYTSASNYPSPSTYTYVEE